MPCTCFTEPATRFAGQRQLSADVLITLDNQSASKTYGDVTVAIHLLSDMYSMPMLRGAQSSVMACRRFDADGSGSISQKEVTQALRCLGVPVRKGLPLGFWACMRTSMPVLLCHTAQPLNGLNKASAMCLCACVLVFVLAKLGMHGADMRMDWYYIMTCSLLDIRGLLHTRVMC